MLALQTLQGHPEVTKINREYYPAFLKPAHSIWERNLQRQGMLCVFAILCTCDVFWACSHPLALWEETPSLSHVRYDCCWSILFDVWSQLGGFLLLCKPHRWRTSTWHVSPQPSSIFAVSIVLLFGYARTQMRTKEHTRTTEIKNQGAVPSVCASERGCTFGRESTLFVL